MNLRTLSMIALLLPGLAAAAGATPRSYGWLEHIRMDLNKPVNLTAKLDTGADYSSLNVESIEPFELNGQTWVRFRFGGQSVEKPVTRHVPLKPKEGGSSQLHWVVTLDFCLHQSPLSADFALVDRSGYTTPAVLGHDVLEALGPIDAAARFTAEPDCTRPELIDTTVPSSGF